MKTSEDVLIFQSIKNFGLPESQYFFKVKMGTWALFLILVCLYRCLKYSRIKKILHFLLISQPSEDCKLGINSEFLSARLELDSL